MKKVAVFGNAGGGKSRLARRLAEATGIPLYCLDTIQFPAGYQPGEKDGGKLPHDEFLKMHSDIIKGNEWIVDGYGTLGISVGTTRHSRYACLRRPSGPDPLPVGHMATRQGSCSKSAGLAGE
jgi:hypothetical protein